MIKIHLALRVPKIESPQLLDSQLQPLRPLDSVVLIDDQFAGTTCASVGCMPSKLLIAAADAAYRAHLASKFGIRTTIFVDDRAVMARLRRLRDEFVDATRESIEEIPEDIRVKQRARFTDRTTLALEDGRKVSAKAVVIASGSRPSVPEPFVKLGDLVLTNETIFELPSLPRSIAVVGAGPLGLELAQALARLGVDTAVFDQGDRLAALSDADVANELKSVLNREFPIRLGVKLEASRDGECARLSSSGASSGTAAFERVLIAAGRPPSLDDLCIETTGLEKNEHDVPLFDPSTMQCGDSSIFLAGDADADRPVLHEASSEGTIAGRNAALFPDVKRTERAVPFSIMFTDPPVAMIGAASKDAEFIGSASYSDQGRAKIEARNAGLVRTYADHDGVITGAALFAPGMDHVSHLLAWAIERGETAGTLLRLPFYHPTIEEGLKSALREICEMQTSLDFGDLDDMALRGA